MEIGNNCCPTLLPLDTFRLPMIKLEYVTSGRTLWLLLVKRHSCNSFVLVEYSLIPKIADFSMDFKGTFLLGLFPGQYNSFPRHFLGRTIWPILSRPRHDKTNCCFTWANELFSLITFFPHSFGLTFKANSTISCLIK